MFSAGVATSLNANALKVTQRGAGANVSVDIAAGDAHLELPSTAYSFWSWTDAVTNLAFTTANVTNPRYDTVVAWVDTTVTTTANVNSPGSFKFKVIAGTAAGSPTVINDAAVQSNLGAGIAWLRLADVLRPAGVDNVTNGNVTDTRVSVKLRSDIQANAIATANVQDGAITPVKTTGIPGEIGRTILGANATTLSIPISSPKKYMEIIVNGISALNSDYYFFIRLNNSSTGYFRRQEGSEGASSGTGSDMYGQKINGDGNSFNMTATLTGRGSGKPVSGLFHSGSTTDVRYGIGIWDTGGDVTSIQLGSTSANGLKAGTEVIVRGNN